MYVLPALQLNYYDVLACCLIDYEIKDIALVDDVKGH